MYTFIGMKEINNRYIGLFVQDQKKRWKALRELISLGVYGSLLYISDENTPDKLIVLFKANAVPVKLVQIALSSEFKLREQVVRAKPVMEALEEKVRSMPDLKTIIFVEMTWAVRTPSGDIYQRELQGAFQQILSRYPKFTIVCIYNESILLDNQLQIGLLSHPMLLTTEGVKENPYYLPPEILMQNRIRDRFEFWMGNVDVERQAKTFDKPATFEQSYAQESTVLTQANNTNEGRWKIRCFGELRVYRENGELINWNTKSGATKKVKTIFAYLLLKGKKGASGEQIADLLWPEAATTEIAMNRFYHTIRFLREVLGGNKNLGKDDSFIVNQNSIYYLQLPYDSWIDLPMFRELCAKGKVHAQNEEYEQAKICYQSAERLYSGQLFKDIPVKYTENGDDDWCWSKRYWHKEMYQKLLYSLASLHIKLGDSSAAISYADRALVEDPNLEEAHREKMIALASLKRFDALARQFKVYSESLTKFNMGTPSPALKALYLELLQKV